jgi:glycosyltransferase involved in cell wall biosynthesis
MLVSCIMPTRGRQAFAARAVACFRAQTWPEKELVVLDDRGAPSFPDGLKMEGVQYHLMPRRLSIGAKRNIAISRAAGDILCHFDDDDWSAPGRIADQVLRMESTGASVTGYNVMTFQNEAGRAWRYTGRPGYALGTSLMYSREFWKQQPFLDQDVGEDGSFIDRPIRLVSVPAGDMMWASIHSGNTSDRREHLTAACWSEIVESAASTHSV